MIATDLLGKAVTLVSPASHNKKFDGMSGHVRAVSVNKYGAVSFVVAIEEDGNLVQDYATAFRVIRSEK